jgi:hypothetical protein
MKQRLYTLLAIVGVLALLASPVAAQQMKQSFDWVIAERLTILNDGITVTDGGVSVTTDGVTITDGGLTVTDDGVVVTDDGITLTDDDLTVASGGVIITAGLIRGTPSTTQTVTMNDSITADGSVTLLSSAGTVNTSTVACGSHGDIVTYVNVGAQSIVISDTGTLKLSGNLTLGATDLVMLQNIWGNCYQLGTVNN